jgi:hypothetical protein
MTAITQLTRFKSDKTEEMVKNARAAKIIFEKHGAERTTAPCAFTATHGTIASRSAAC